MHNKKDYKSLTLAIKLIALENFLITLPAIIVGIVSKDSVIFQKIIIVGNIIPTAFALISFLVGLIFYIPKNIMNDNAIIKFFNFIIETLLGSTMNVAFWLLTIFFLSSYHLIPDINDDVRLLITISSIITIPFLISFYVLFEFGDKIFKTHQKDNN